MASVERVEVTVRGEHTAYLPPERATVHAEVSLEGPSAQAVHDGVAASGRALGEAVRPLHDPAGGPVTWWASDQVRTWAQRPWNDQGTQLPLVHHARLDLHVKFSDFAALGAWLAHAATVTGFTVQRIEWALTADHRLRVVAQTRAAAVRQAQEKAQAYADALGLGAVHPVALADAGMLGEGLAPQEAGGAAYARMASSSGGQAVDLVPQDIAVAARVDARFATG